MREVISGIYCIENKENNKKYIGFSINIYRRWQDHKCVLKKGNHHSSCLQKDWNFYGENNFSFYILERCASEMLQEKEIFYIKKFNSQSPHGYNLTSGGDGVIGLSEESRKKLIEWHTGRPMKEETKKKLSIFYKEYFKNNDAPMKGKKTSKESKRKQSKAKRGKKFIFSSSNYIGVRLKDKKYEVSVCLGKRGVYIGRFDDEKEAAIMYNRAAKEILGEDAVLNRVDLGELSEYEYISSLEKNYKKRKNVSSKFVGVSYDSSRSKWMSSFCHNKETFHIGRFNTELEAAIAYNEIAIEFFGYKAKLNIITKEEYNSVMINS